MTFFFIGAIGLMAVVGYYAWLANQRRREGLMMLAASKGYEMHMGDIRVDEGLFASNVLPGFISLVHDTWPFGHGSRRRVSELLYASRDDVDWYLFKYSYVISSGKHTQYHSYSIVMARVPMTFAQMRLRPQHMFDSVSSMLGFADLEFELEEFNRIYHVTSSDHKMAYDIVNHEVIDYLMTLPPRDWTLGPCFAMVVTTAATDAQGLDRMQQDLEGLLSRVPDFVKQQIGFAANWAGPLD